MTLPQGAPIRSLTHLFQSHSDDFNNYSQGQGNSVNLDNAIQKVFFSQANIDYLQKNLIRKVYKYGGYQIDRQSDKLLIDQMQNVYPEYKPLMDYGLPVTDHIKKMDELLLNKLTRQVISAIREREHYLNHLEDGPTPIDQPIYTHIKGSKGYRY